jgi:hypothetical protein
MTEAARIRELGENALSQPLIVQPPALVVSCGDCEMENTATCDDCVVTWLLRNEEVTATVVSLSPRRPQAKKQSESVAFAEEELDTLRVLQDAGLAPALRHIQRHPAHASLVSAS